MIQQENLLAFSPHYPFMLNVKQGSFVYQFFKYFGPTRRKNRTQVTRLQSRRSYHYTRASKPLHLANLSLFLHTVTLMLNNKR